MVVRKHASKPVATACDRTENFLGVKSSSEIGSPSDIAATIRKKKTLFKKIMDETGISGGPECCIAGAKEFRKRFRKDPNVSVQLAIPLSKDILSIDNIWLTREVT